MYDLLLVRYGEIGTKGKNRRMFEQRLQTNIEAALKDLGIEDVERAHARLYVPLTASMEEMIERLQKVFGIASFSPVVQAPLQVEAIKEAAVEVVADSLKKRRIGEGDRLTFKVITHRANKGFPITSPEMSRDLGACLLRRFPQLSVDVHQPELAVEVEIREHYSYIYTERIPGAGGLPVGVSGKGVLLLSGGIDSPVAGYLMMKRGVAPIAVHFHSYPFTSERAKEKVLDLAEILSAYGGPIPVHVVHFTEIQKAINQHCPPKLMITIMRRMMLRLAEAIARREGAAALITGESLGQVSSQTMDSILVTNAVVQLPVFRPLIGFDKTEIVDIAERIDTYKISIRPYEDCCTIFVPRHPETHPKLAEVEKAEKKLPLEELLDEALARTEVIICGDK
ncbi:MAG: tRNA 4-thiouridine(8) synthase ThiI [Firmicutes bacterium]|nr:tRNA 4-thiouridine(8) synthase ThiI [Bacillota bacterium]